MRVLVTGGMGFIGSNFVRYVLQEHSDVEVINLDRLSYGSSPTNQMDVQTDKRYRFVRGDICDFDLLKETAKTGVDALINLAGESHVDRSISSPRSFLESNTIGVLNLLEICRLYDITFQQTSSDEVYGPTPENDTFAEDHMLHPSSPEASS